MALEYTLEIATDLTVGKLLESIASLPAFEAAEGELNGEGVSVRADVEDKLGRSLMEEAFQFSPSVYVRFRVEKFEKWETGVENALKAALHVLQVEKGDAAMLFNGEDVVFLRTAGKLVLNNGWEFWTPARMGLIQLPHEVADIPSLK